MNIQKLNLKNLSAPLLIALAVSGFALNSSPFANASHLNGQINELNQQNSENREAQDALEVEAASLADKVNRLQAEITGLESQIRDNQAKNDEVQRQITKAEEELVKQKKLLGENIKQMYLEGDISTLEMLASSKDLSEFMDKQAYRNAIQDKIKTTLDKVTALKLDLKMQKEIIDKLLADQKSMQSQLDSQRSEQNRLLGLNQSQQASVEQEIKGNNAQIAELKRQQAAENARLFGTTPGTGANCGGGYPGSAPGPWGTWGCNYPLDNAIDSWGMYNRECVSYTAFKVASSGRYMPYWGGRGNAKQWDDNARGAGIPVDSNPRSGDVGISNNGVYGHSFYVEQVAGDGSIYISDYNQQFDGRYREYWVSAETVRFRGLVFIHFP
ncbi:hypothetical protein A3D14_00260 [Candidatus Saccharibacteria bacterium RIFCSPHIGHO2_02_FULL_47_12]|nr:MAG: hypothetical protein A3D14_00260 [Candidatus Saccharibacteria bacterium RIFCSPHIGHO2_02_FULL_47_12]